MSNKEHVRQMKRRKKLIEDLNHLINKAEKDGLNSGLIIGVLEVIKLRVSRGGR